MNPLTVLEQTKLNTIKNKIKTFKNMLIVAGLTQKEVQSIIFRTILGKQYDQYITSGKSHPEKQFSDVFANFVTFKKQQNLLKTLTKIEVNLHFQMNSFKEISFGDNGKTKKSDAYNQKNKKNKKQKKDKRKQTTSVVVQQKTTQNAQQSQKPKNIFLMNPSSNQNSIFKRKQPLQQSISSTNMPSLFSFVKRAQNQQSLNPLGHPMNILVINQGNNRSNITDERIRERQEMKKNLRQINMFKQFIQKQMLLDVLGSQNAQDSIDTIDFGNMLAGPFGMSELR